MSHMVNAKEAKKVIQQKGLKIYKVAADIGIEADTLGKFLNGRGNLGKPAQILLAIRLGLREEAS